MGIGGTVHFRFVVGVNGRVTECRLTRSSGSGALDTTWTPQRLFVFQHPLEPDEKVERQRQYALGWNACIDAIEKGIAPPPASEEG